MKQQTPNTLEAEQIKVLQEMKRTVRRELIKEMQEVSLRDRTITECRELANSTSQVISLLQKYNFPSMLSAADQQRYDEIMTQLSLSGLRCQVLVEESNAEDYGLFLAATPPVSNSIN